jgi:hypothetical protein
MYYQLLAHLIGDFVLQSEWMAVNKSKRSFPALVHVFFYTLPFLFLTTDISTLLIISGTHFLIDRFGLARYICRLRNHICPIRQWFLKKENGTPVWLEFWLVVIVDNTMHLVINAFALGYTVN